jgi:Flp pilus assembly protein CpaB
MNQKTKTAPLIVGIILCVVAAVAFFLALTRVRDESNIIVAKENIAAFSYVDQSNSEPVGVPKSSITENDITEKEFNDLENKFATSTSFLAGQRIDKRSIVKGESSFGVVLPDERVVAVTSTVSGIGGGLIKPGDIVDVQIGGGSASGGNQTVSEFSKVLCVALDPNECQDVVPDGVKVPTSQTNSEQIMVVLATPENDAASIAGQEVTLSLNPFCRVDARGYFFSPRASEGSGFRCAPDPSRLASKPPATNPAEGD